MAELARIWRWSDAPGRYRRKFPQFTSRPHGYLLAYPSIWGVGDEFFQQMMNLPPADQLSSYANVGSLVLCYVGPKD